MPHTRRAFLSTLPALLGCRSNSALGNIPDLMARLNVPGLSITTIEDARIKTSLHYGVRNQSTRVPIDDQTIFEAQSMSKPVFAYRVMKLVELGALDLDKPLTTYTTERFLPDEPRLDQITARHVLSHTTGLPGWRSSETPLRLSFNPGTKWQYSGEGFHYLQTIVTRLTGQTDPTTCANFEQDYRACATNFAGYMTANLLEPFAMHSSAYLWSPAIESKLAIAHDKQGRPAPRPRNKAVDVARYGSAGALLATANDYARFLIEVMDPKPADAYRLSRNTLKEMLRPQIALPSTSMRYSWALGWQIWHAPQGDLVAHGGDIAGYHSQSAFSVEKKRGFVIMTNGENGWELITSHLLQHLIPQYA